MGNGLREANPDQEPFGARFVDFGGLQAGNYKRLRGALGNSRFGPNPGQEPFGSRFGKTSPGSKGGPLPKNGRCRLNKL